MQLENMFLRFHPNCAEQAAAFAKKLPPETISMAKLQGYFLHVRLCAERAALYSQSRDAFSLTQCHES